MFNHMPPEFSLDTLNPPQKQAVLATEGPVLVLAGAGTGKTRVLSVRVAHILNEGLASSFQILAVTFTNKAAQEMRERVYSLMGHVLDDLWMGTFHALAVKILRRHADLIDFNNNFNILDQDDQKRLIKQLLKAGNIDEKQFSVNYVASVINRWKDRALTPDKVPSGSQKAILINLYHQYQDRLKILNSMDFGDLLLNCLLLFQKCPEVLKKYQKQFRYILVDEYQDTNVAQYLWLRLLAQGSNNICCVGDDDQSIYGWRGAEIGNILKFEQDFPGAVIIRLEQNYRSTAHILGAASGLIANNTGRLGKTLWTECHAGDKILIRGTWDNDDEARFVADEVEAGHRSGMPLGQMAILVRAGFQTREFEERFLKLGIPYKVVGGMRFYERQEIRDAVAYLRLLVQPDDSLAFERIINLPKRGIGTVTLQQMHGIAREQAISLTRAAFLYAADGKTSRSKETIQEFLVNVDKWRKLLNTYHHVEVAKIVLDESGYTKMWMEDPSPDAPGRLENLKELITALGEFTNLNEFLDHISLVMENKQERPEDMINIMTLHAAKGLEFDWVFLPGWEENLFPHPKCLNDNGLEGLEEERRLGYVGISRARKRTVISYCMQRRSPNYSWQVGMPSRFLKELPKDHCIHIGPNAKQRKF